MRAARVSIDTKFHIEFEWWDKQNKDIRVFMQELLCPESREAVSASSPEQTADVVDMETAEVTQVGPTWEAIRDAMARRPRDDLSLDATRPHPPPVRMSGASFASGPTRG